ncbi:FeoC-like transcriptional regulator [Legionella sp. CNM-4043-24]|uniref:FeoC-like transcriptional regulator n=1 Tax=Legionella sp. CNM-4043-24 TaxID=3421646 RepID=UPI00403B16EE
MLLDIRNYLQREKVASNQQLAREFSLDISALQPMLDIWVRKGVIAHCQEESACKSRCFKCRIPPAYYRFVSDK